MKPHALREKILTPFLATAILVGGVACGDNNPFADQTVPAASSEPLIPGAAPNTSIQITPYPTEGNASQAEILPAVSVVLEPEINRGTVAPTPPITAETTTTQEAEKPVLREGVYCGMPLELVLNNPEQVKSILKAVNITEVHPPCTNAHGRDGTGALNDAEEVRKLLSGEMEIVPGYSLVKANQVMLEFGKQNGFKYYVDDPRFLSGDPAQIQTAFNDYQQWAVEKNVFGIELKDESQSQEIQDETQSLRTLVSFIKEQGLEITDMVRFNLAYVPESINQVVQQMVDIFGADVKLGIDAYRLDDVAWENINNAMNQPGKGIHIKDWSIAVKTSQWARLPENEASAMTPEKIEAYFKSHPDGAPSAEEIAGYYQKALQYQASGAKGVYLFSGFKANPNIYGVIFYGDLTQPENISMVQQGREIAGVGPDNKFALNP